MGCVNIPLHQQHRCSHVLISRLSSLGSTWSRWWLSSSASSPSTPCQHPLNPLPPLPPPSVRKVTLRTRQPSGETSPTGRRLWGSLQRKRLSRAGEGRRRGWRESRDREGRSEHQDNHRLSKEGAANRTILLSDTALKCELQHGKLSMCHVHWHIYLFIETCRSRLELNGTEHKTNTGNHLRQIFVLYEYIYTYVCVKYCLFFITGL